MNVTDVCNMALSYLGKGRIASLDEQTEQARQCKLFYEYTKQRLLREYTWGFAKRILKLAELDTINPFYGYVYAYPNNCVGIKRVFNCDNRKDCDGSIRKVANLGSIADEREVFEIFMVSDNVRGIATNVPNAWCEYTYDVVDMNICSSDFIEALTHMLAYEMCLSLTGNMQLKTSEYQEAMAVLSRARYTSASEGHKKIERECGYFDGRA